MNRAIRHWPYAALGAAALVFAGSQLLAGSDRVREAGQLVRYATAVPDRARAEVQATYDAVGRATVVLTVTGLRDSTWYGAHVHELPCGARPDDAGQRFQNVPDPDQPSTRPEYANPANEIWLDVHTGVDGSGTSRARVPWQFKPTRRAGSVMLHAERTRAGWAGAGTAGPAVACLTVAF